METTNIYDFLHLLNLIWILGGIWHLHIMPQYMFFKIFLSKKIQKGSQANTKVRSKKHTMAFIHLIFFQIRVQLVILFYFI